MTQNKKNILIIDDDAFRHTTFTVLYNKHELSHVYTYNDALDTLKSNKFDVVFLDHDLQGAYIEDPILTVEKTGLDIAIWMTRNLLEKPKVYIHSMNPVGSRMIFMMLSEAGFPVTITPFHLLPSI